MAQKEEESLEMRVRRYIVKRGSRKRDITGLYQDTALRGELVSVLAEQYRGKIDLVVSPESLGFILGSMLAAELGVGFVPIRGGAAASEGMLRAVYVDHRDCARALQVPEGYIPRGARVLLADDWVETAATIQACMAIVEEAEGVTIGIVSIGAAYNEATKKMLDEGLLRSICCDH